MKISVIGTGYAGLVNRTCSLKDIQTLAKMLKAFGYIPRVLNALEAVRKDQKKVIKRFGEDLSNKIFAIWRLTFKPETDDMHEASSVTIINELTSRGAEIVAYDPKARYEAENFYLKGNERVRYVDSKYEALTGADAVILVTEWQEFRSPDFGEIHKLLKSAVFFDGRNQYSKDRMQDMGFEYFQIGVSS